MWFPAAKEEWGLGRGGNREVGGEKTQLECQCHSMPFWDCVPVDQGHRQGHGRAHKGK